MSALLEVEFPRTAAAPRLARHWLKECFAAWLDDDEIADAQLLVSELVTNAVVHGRGMVQVRASLDDVRLRVQVADRGGALARTIGDGAPTPRGGRGLAIVDAVASRWGIAKGAARVWFELDCRRALRT